MARRSRSRRARDPRMLGAVAAALVVTGRVLDAGRPSPTSPPGSSGGAGIQAPRRIGGTVECPPGWPVLAVDNHTSYPPGHPGEAPGGGCGRLLPDRRPGHRRRLCPGALPPGAVEVGGVYLSPTSRTFRAGCRRAADRLGFAVPC
jgi:hypothetical protein